MWYGQCGMPVGAGKPLAASAAASSVVLQQLTCPLLSKDCASQKEVCPVLFVLSRAILCVPSSVSVPLFYFKKRDGCQMLYSVKEPCVNNSMGLVIVEKGEIFYQNA